MNRARAVVVKEIDVGVPYAAVDTVNFFGQFRIGLDIQCFQDGYRIVRTDDPPFPDTLDQACIDAVLAQPKMPNSVIGSGEACKCEDHFKAAHPDTDWEAALIHSEKIGLGSREYELVKI